MSSQECRRYSPDALVSRQDAVNQGDYHVGIVVSSGYSPTVFQAAAGSPTALQALGQVRFGGRKPSLGVSASVAPFAALDLVSM